MTTMTTMTSTTSTSTLHNAPTTLLRKLVESDLVHDLPRNEPVECYVGRYLKSCGNDVNEAYSSIRANLRWRRESGAEELGARPLTSVLPRGCDVGALVSKFPVLQRGVDKQARPVLYLLASHLDLRGALKVTNGMDDFMRYQIWVRERSVAYVFAQAARRGAGGGGNARAASPPEPPYYTSVLDLKGVRLAQAHSDFYHCMRKIIELDQCYPNRIGTMIIVNTPFFFHLIWSVLKGYISANAEKKIIITSGDPFAALHQHIDVDQIPREFGGSGPGLLPIRLDTVGGGDATSPFFCERVHFRAGEALDYARLFLVQPPVDGSRERGHNPSRASADSMNRETKERRERESEVILVTSTESEGEEGVEEEEERDERSGPTRRVRREDDEEAEEKTRFSPLEPSVRLEEVLARGKWEEMVAAREAVERDSRRIEGLLLARASRLRRRIAWEKAKLREERRRARRTTRNDHSPFPELLGDDKGGRFEKEPNSRDDGEYDGGAEDDDEEEETWMSLDELHRALGEARDVRDAHRRALAFARNYIEVEQAEWSEVSRTLQGRLQRLRDENVGLRRTMLVMGEGGVPVV